VVASRQLPKADVDAQTPFTLEFYEDKRGLEPAKRWMDDLDANAQRVLAAALEEVLAHQGIGVCGSEWGRQLGGGLFEFRVRNDALLLRVFCHAYGDKVVLLLSGYDKGRDVSAKRQQKEIERARRLLKEFRTGRAH